MAETFDRPPDQTLDPKLATFVVQSNIFAVLSQVITELRAGADAQTTSTKVYRIDCFSTAASTILRTTVDNSAGTNGTTTYLNGFRVN